MPRPRGNGLRFAAAQRAHEDERNEAEERDHGEQRQLVAGPVDARALGGPEIPKLVRRSPTANLIVFSGTRDERALREDTRDDDDDERGDRAGDGEAEAAPERRRTRSR